MLARLNVRTKLLVIMLPLLLAVGVLSSIGVLDRLDQRSTASANQQLVTAARAGSEVAYRLQLERLDAVARVSGLTSPITNSEANTDVATKQYLNRLAALVSDGVENNGESVQPTYNTLKRTFAELNEARGMGAKAGTQPSSVQDAYTSVIDAVISADFGFLSEGGTKVGSGAAARWLIAATEADARAASDAAIIIGATKAGTSVDVESTIAETAQLRVRSDSWIAVFVADTNVFGRGVYDKVLATPGFTASQPGFAALATIPATGLTTDPNMWLTQSTDRIDAMWGGQQALLQHESEYGNSRLDDLERQVRYYLAGSAAALFLGLLLAARVTRLITSSVARLTEAARVISKESLPRLVDSLRHPENEVVFTPTPINLRARDEFADLAEAFGAVEQTAISVAAEQSATLRKGISDIFVNLARRNQSLLDRQIEFIDRLETNEEDPDQLENLFKLDHLATRMRRNAESLLVLAGAEAPRRRGREVSMTDVIRVAVGEVEDFVRITLLAVDPVDARGSAAVDVAHLLSELMENGAQYSPPDKRVDVIGHSTSDGGYVISITDQGMGMTPAAMAEANTMLARPPIVGLELSRSLGFIVVSTLAARHNIAVALSPSASGGVTALITLPPDLIVQTAGYAPDLPVGVTHSDSGISVGQVGSPLLAAGFDSGEDWLTPMPVFEEAPPITASFEVSGTAAEDATEPWIASADEARDRNIDALQAFDLAGDPFAPFASNSSESSPTAPMGAAFEAGLFSLIEAPETPRPSEPNVDDGNQLATEAASDSDATPEPPGPSGPMPRRTTMWQSPDRASLPPLPGIPPASLMPTSIPAAVTVTQPPPVPGTSTPAPDAPVHSGRTPFQPSPSAHTPVAAPMTPLLGGDPVLPRRPVEVPATPQLSPQSFRPSTPGAPTAPSAPSEPGALPQRRRTTFAAVVPAAGPQVGAPSRPPDEVRNILSRYRSGLDQGRLIASPIDVTAPAADDAAPDAATAEPELSGQAELSAQAEFSDHPEFSDHGVTDAVEF